MLEILIAALIFALIIAGLTSVFVAGKGHLQHSRARITAAELGRYFLDPLQMQVRQDQWGANCVSDNINCPTVTPESRTIDNTTYDTSYSSDNLGGTAGTNLRRVMATVRWNEGP